jgi:hypothetical protein
MSIQSQLLKRDLSSVGSVSPRRGKKKPSGLVKPRKRSISSARSTTPPTVRTGEELLPWLLEEFPFLHLSSETIHDLWRKSSRNVEQMAKAEKELKRKRNKQQEQVNLWP